MRKWPAVSLLLNATLLGAVALKVRAVGLGAIGQRLGLRPSPRPDFARLARERFTSAAPGEVAFVGDSQVQHAPLHDIFGRPYRNRGLSNARLGEVETWLDQVLAERPSHVVLMAGTNDVWFGVPLAESVAACRRMLGRIREGGCGATVVAVPPVVGHESAVATLNAQLASLASEAGAAWVDLTSTLTELDWTEDGVHLSGAAYRAVAPAIARTLPDAGQRLPAT